MNGLIYFFSYLIIHFFALFATAYTTKMSFFSQLCEFSINTEEWFTYIERLEVYFSSNGIDDDTKKKAIMLCVVGSENYKLIRDLTAPDTPADKTYGQLKTIIGDHLNSAKHHNIIAERFAFNTRNRKPLESVMVYITELRRLSKYCDYGDSTDDMIRDRLVCGIGHLNTQLKLLSEGSNLTFTGALQISLNMDLENKHSEMTQSQLPEVIKFNAYSETLESQTLVSNHDNKIGLLEVAKDCFRCGNKHHPENCSFLDQNCFLCKNKGHSIYMCHTIQSIIMKTSSLGAKVSNRSCFRCGNKHHPEKCVFKDQNCFLCKTNGHSIRMCTIAQSSIMHSRVSSTDVNKYSSHSANIPSQTSPLGKVVSLSKVISTKHNNKDCFHCGNICQPESCPFNDEKCFLSTSKEKSIKCCSSPSAIMPSQMSPGTITGLSEVNEISTQHNNKDCFHCGNMCQPESCPFNDEKCFLSTSKEKSIRCCSSPSAIMTSQMSPGTNEVSAQLSNKDCFHCGDMCQPESCPFNDEKCFLSKSKEKSINMCCSSQPAITQVQTPPTSKVNGLSEVDNVRAQFNEDSFGYGKKHYQENCPFKDHKNLSKTNVHSIRMCH